MKQENIKPLAVNAKTVLKLLSISATSLYWLIKKKKITPLSLHKRNRLFKMADVEALLNSK